MITITNNTDFAVDKAFFLGVAKKVLAGENKRTENISVAFVSESEIRELNKKYRRKDNPTDVLSFGKVSDFKEECLEVIICPAQVKEKTKQSPLSLKKELARTMIHGILHVLGYDHEASLAQEKKMFAKEEYYFQKTSS